MASAVLHPFDEALMPLTQIRSFRIASTFINDLITQEPRPNDSDVSITRAKVSTIPPCFTIPPQ